METRGTSCCNTLCLVADGENRAREARRAARLTTPGLSFAKEPEGLQGELESEQERIFHLCLKTHLASLRVPRDGSPCV